MKERRTADEVARLLRDVDRDLAKGRTVSGAGRKLGIAETTSSRWRQRHDPAVVEADRRRRELEAEVDRLKRPVAELSLGEFRVERFSGGGHRCESSVRAGRPPVPDDAEAGGRVSEAASSPDRIRRSGSAPDRSPTDRQPL